MHDVYVHVVHNYVLIGILLAVTAHEYTNARSRYVLRNESHPTNYSHSDCKQPPLAAEKKFMLISWNIHSKAYGNIT